MNEPISVVLKNNRQGIGHKNSSNDRTVGVLMDNINDNKNNTTIINDVKQNKNNNDGSTGNTYTKKAMKREKNAVKVRQEKMREKRIRMELYSKNAVSDEHIDLLLSNDGYKSDTKRGGKKRKKKRYGW